MRRAKTYLLPWNLLFVILLLYCSERLTTPQEEEPHGIEDVINVKWTLEAVDVEGQKMDLSPYDQFNLVYEENAFWGDDGCNYFHGSYSIIKSDSVYPFDWSITEMYCGGKQFSIGHLCQPYRVIVQGNELRIYSNGSNYTYRSDFVDAIEDSLFIKTKWKLQSTDDPNFKEAQSLRVHSSLFFDANRLFNFQIQGIHEDLRFSYEANGIFGIHDNRIMFYTKGCHGQGLDSYEWELTLRIPSTSFYTTENDTLTLYNEKYDTSYKFVLE